MPKMQHLLFFILFIAGINTQKKSIYLPSLKSLIIQADQLHHQSLPQFFDMYQSSSLTSLSHNNNNNNSSSSPSQQNTPPICQIQQLQPSTFITKNVFYHYRLADPQRFFLGRKKISTFAELNKLQGIIDVVEFHDQVIVLFQNGYYSLTSIDQTGKITSNQVKLLYDQELNTHHQSNYSEEVLIKTAVNYGKLLKSQQFKDYLLFVGEDKARLLNTTSKIFEDLANFEPIGIQFEDAILVGDIVYVAVGQKGVLQYQVDFSKRSIKLIRKFKPQLTYNKNVSVQLQVSTLAWDPYNKQLIINDQQQGIHWLQLQSTSQNQNTSQPITPKHSLFIQRCSNLQIISQQNLAIATCPQLLIINLTSRTHQIIDQIQFDPDSVIVNESRIIILGEYRYAVYDIETDLVMKGESQVNIDFAAIVENYIVIVNMFSISIGEIHPEQQELTCLANSQKYLDLPNNKAFNLTIQGICSQLYQSPMISCQQQPQQQSSTILQNIFYPTKQQLTQIITHRTQPQNCQIIYSINLSIVNSSDVSYWWQIVAGVVIGWILCSSMIIYCVKDIKVRKEYEQLKEEVATARDKKSQEQTNSQLFGEK